jgi:hypothetical protein
MKRVLLALFCLPATAAQITLTPTQYDPGGYSTITWSGSQCVKSSAPAYEVWDTTAGDEGGRSVAPSVSTVFTLTCSDGSVSKSLTVGSVPPVVTPTTAGPVCYPDISLPVKARTIEVDPALFNGDNRLTLWTCRTVTGYKNERWSWKLSDVAPWVERALGGVLDESAARAWAVANAGTLPASVRTQSQALDQYEATAKVATNGTSLTRPVYPLNADGTRNTTAIAGVRAAVGAACDISKRVGTTSYYAVTGGVTLCTFTAPSGIND